MAYVVELEEDPNAESDIPTTIMRSVAESGYSRNKLGGQGGPTSSEMVVEKLTEILAYLRSGKTSRKVTKKGDAPSVPIKQSSKPVSKYPADAEER